MDHNSLEIADHVPEPGVVSIALLMERIDSIADVPLPVEVELDRKILSVRSILALTAGSVVKLGRSAGENIDIRVGGSLMGFGEIVILEDSTGVRITDFWGEA